MNARNPRRDHGSTFIEILISVVLMGTAVIAVLAAVRVTVIGSAIERDHSKAQAWLQSAAGVVEDSPFGECTSVNSANENAIRNGYRTAILARAPSPFALSGSTVDVVDLDVWDGAAFVDFTSQGSTCLDDALLRQQLVTIEVTSPDGDIVEQLQVVKQDRS